MNNFANDWNAKFQIVRDKMTWSDAVQAVQRRRTARTDSDSTTGADNEQPPPRPPPEALQAAKKSSCCSCQRTRSRTREEPALQQVVAKLYNAELEEAVSNEKVEAKRERLRLAAQVLEAQVLFSKSLDLKARALARLTQMTGNFAYKEMASSSELDGILDDIRWDICGQTEKLAEVADVASAAVETPDRLCQLLDDFQENNEGFHSYSKSFSQYLRTNKVSTDKLRKAEFKYNSIKGTYVESRALLEEELSKLIEERHAVIGQCFSKLTPIQKEMVKQDKQFLALSKEVSKSLQEPKKQARSSSHSCIKQEIRK